MGEYPWHTPSGIASLPWQLLFTSTLLNIISSRTNHDLFASTVQTLINPIIFNFLFFHLCVNVFLQSILLHNEDFSIKCKFMFAISYEIYPLLHTFTSLSDHRDYYKKDETEYFLTIVQFIWKDWGYILNMGIGIIFQWMAENARYGNTVGGVVQISNQWRTIIEMKGYEVSE